MQAITCGIWDHKCETIRPYLFSKIYTLQPAIGRAGALVTRSAGRKEHTYQLDVMRDLVEGLGSEKGRLRDCSCLDKVTHATSKPSPRAGLIETRSGQRSLDAIAAGWARLSGDLRFAVTFEKRRASTKE